MITSKAFIEQVIIPLREGWGYIYGTAGKLWTKALQDQLNRTADEKRALSRRYGAKWIGKRVTDCSGLIYWAVRQLGGDIAHHARYQYTDGCRRKGRLVNGLREDGTAPLPGSAVFLKGGKDHIHHVGVYIGEALRPAQGDDGLTREGTVVEAKGARYGVVTSPLSRWEYWGELKAVDYSDASKAEAPELLPAEAAGEAVKKKDCADEPGDLTEKAAALSLELYALAEKLRQWAGGLKGGKSE